MIQEIGECGCCHKEKPIIGVACIPGIPMSIAWCEDCLRSGAIPYEAAVCNTAMCGGLDHTNEVWQELVDVTLTYHGKTHEEFNMAVANAFESMDNASNS